MRKNTKKKTQELNKKKRKEQTKQAKLDKAITIAQIGLNIALAIVKASTMTPFYPLGLAAMINAGVIGSIQLAAAIATPIPKYAKGTTDHIGGLAEVAEVRPEVIIEPNKAPYVVKDRSLLNLPKHTQVVPSLAEYDRIMNHSLMDSIQLNQRNIDNYQANQSLQENKEMISLMKENNSLLKKRKHTYVKTGDVNIDFGYEIWKNNNIDW